MLPHHVPSPVWPAPGMEGPFFFGYFYFFPRWNGCSGRVLLRCGLQPSTGGLAFSLWTFCRSRSRSTSAAVTLLLLLAVETVTRAHPGRKSNDRCHQPTVSTSHSITLLKATDGRGASACLCLIPWIVGLGCGLWPPADLAAKPQICSTKS